MRILFINCQSFKTAFGLSDTIEKYDNETFEKDKNRDSSISFGFSGGT
jgi:hypothetical protein